MLLYSLVFLPLLSSALCWLIGRKSKQARNVFAAAVGLIELALAILCWFSGNETAQIPLVCSMGLTLETDGFRRVYCLIISFMWAMTLLFSPEYFAHHHNRNRYYFFNLLTLGATMGVFLAADLYTAFVFFEIMSFTSFTWVIQEETEGAIRAANTYLAVAVIGGLVALMGLFLLQRELGTTMISQLYSAAQSCPHRSILYIAGACILFGFGAKAGMFPLHIWLPKAHPVAPAPASSLLSGVLTKSGIWGILAISCHIFRHDPAWGTLILCLGCVTMFLGALLALFSIDLKRTLACSSMSQIGFVLVGVGMMGLLGEENALAARGTLLHMMNHSLFKLDLFLCAGVVYMNLHKLDLNEIRGFGRGKVLLTAAFLLGALGIGGIPLLNGYISKTLLHEAIVEGAHHYGWPLKAAEWVFLISGGLTLAYMTKLFVAVFVEKNETRQEAYDQKKSYINLPSACALSLAAVILPILGFSAGTSMNAIADIGTDFLHAGHLEHEVHFYIWENLKGAVISVLIGGGVYLLVVRKLLMKDGRYVNRWPDKLDLEELIYRPLLTRWLPGLFGWIAAIFGENKVSTTVCRGVLAFGKWFAALFGENKLTGPLARGIHEFGKQFAGLFGENRLTGPLAIGLTKASSVILRVCSDSLDAVVVLLRKTVYRQSPVRSEDPVLSDPLYRIGAGLDKLRAEKTGQNPDGRYAKGLYRAGQTFRSTSKRINGSLSFALLALVLAVCGIFLYMLR